MKGDHMNTTRTEAAKDIAEMMNVWNTVYAVALKPGPHNPSGSEERAEQLTRAYMAGVLRIKLK